MVPPMISPVSVLWVLGELDVDEDDVDKDEDEVEATCDADVDVADGRAVESDSAGRVLISMSARFNSDQTHQP